MGSGAEALEERVEKMLNGEGLEVTDLDLMTDQLQAVTLRKTVCYIVSAVIFNDKGEVLMVQEAKPQCYGRWYLPAGRMEVGESIHEALCREVKEEAGLDCEPITMLLVEEQGQQWIRFTFLAQVKGGSLKTTAEADAESLQAQWWDREAPLSLRGRDILSLIDAGFRYRETVRFPVCLPVNLPCAVVCQRLLLTFISNTHSEPSNEESLWLLLTNHSTDSETHTDLPVAVSEKAYPVTVATYKLIRECFPSSCKTLNMNVHGILGVQHDGRVHGQTDGICFNMLVALDHAEDEAVPGSPPPLENKRFTWQEVTNQILKRKILSRIKDRTLLPMNSL
ncbi:8-oxo-dGDP phosphatase NUDT18 [Trichomycterus rosablanca]|uniref:8-oxo-dGDP phosphatase NUDT18 n=1 Tax=Trichomycterus rosablanca TaxID=2290929 RepID=UPI002F351842